MLAQVTFKTDDELKRQALAKAKRDGITLKAFFTYCMRSYTSGGLDLGIVYQTPEREVEEIPVTPRIQNKMDNIARLL